MRKIYLMGILIGLCMLMLTACQTQDKVYHWAVLQNGRLPLEQKKIEQINERLKELGVEGQIEFHFIKTEELVTPAVLQQTYQDLNRKMDFVSISPSLVALYKEDWQDNFVDLSGALQSGKLKEFYEMLPEAVWNANRIAGGIYSFSNSKQVQEHGFGFYQDMVDQIGAAKLQTLQAAEGLEDEEVWKALYEANGEQPICAWTTIDWNAAQGTPENPYPHAVLKRLANGWHEHEFAMLTDDIGFNYETGAFEWLGDSPAYIEIKDKVIDFYEKGYIRAHDIAKIREVGEDKEIGRMVYGMQEQKDAFALWIPSYETMQISARENYAYMYSLVYKKAQKGWEQILNAIGKDEQITGILNDYYDLTATALLQSEGAETQEDRYAALKSMYEKAELSEVQNFIFNPASVQDLWEECNGKAAVLGDMKFREEAVITLEDGTEKTVEQISVKKINQFWNSYKEILQEASIRKLLMEVNRQYQEWTRK